MGCHRWCAIFFIGLSLLSCDGVDGDSVTHEPRTSSSHQGVSPGQKGASDQGCETFLAELIEDSSEDAYDLDHPNGVEEFDPTEKQTWSYEESISEEKSYIIQLAEAATYEGEIGKLLARACVGCHKPGGDRPDLSTYTLAKNGGPSSLSSIRRNRMPTRTPLVQEEKDLFQAWADAGYPQGQPNPPQPVPAPIPPSEPISIPSLPPIPPLGPNPVSPLPNPDLPSSTNASKKAPVRSTKNPGCRS